MMSTELAETRSPSAAMRNLEDIYELSPLQLDNFNRYLTSQGDGLFHENLIFNFVGEIDDRIFTQCWNEILKRHSILRTAFINKGIGKPIQAVLRKALFPIQIHDWTGISEEEQAHRMEVVIEADRLIPYCMEEAPLMRVTLIHLNDRKFRLWWRFHHMIMDGWAFTVVLFDFLQLYKQLSSSGEVALMLPGYPYKDYIRYLKNRDTAEESAFWPEYLQGCTHQPPLSLLKPPAPEAPVSQIRQGRLDYHIYELFQPLQEVIKASKVTMNGVFQGIFSLLISHLSGGGADVVTGQTVADRPMLLENAQARVGLFVNTLPIRCQIRKEEGFVEWVRGIQTSMMNTFRFASSSEQEIKHWCGMSDDRDLFHSALVFKNIPLADDPFVGLPFRTDDYNLESRPHFPLSLFVWPEAKLELKLIYDNSLYSSESAWSVLNNVRAALVKFIEHPDISVSSMMDFDI
ncbi:condensation domain-containing protein [Paenibacillus sp. FSL P4-0338]|uniref:condensation domain-containing protein n=1 Tax=unclassified Paenibacillus TaxID=185978 RepID=UPI0004B75A34|nr:condensation domain-containing protein [Paenibacillus sp. FSL R7-269]